ncbi:MAG TPA: hypothetical protein VMH22_07535 [bacterium]|nr:hypothetical protein [bacterium]
MKLQAASNRPQARSPEREASLIGRLLRDETAVTATEYVVATLAIAFASLAASRAIAGALIPYLHRIYLVVTLPVA